MEESSAGKKATLEDSICSRVPLLITEELKLEQTRKKATREDINSPVPRYIHLLHLSLSKFSARGASSTIPITSHSAVKPFTLLMTLLDLDLFNIID